MADNLSKCKYFKAGWGFRERQPSDYPDFAAWLVRQGINSISLNPDTAIKTALVIAEEEAAQARTRAA